VAVGDGADPLPIGVVTGTGTGDALERGAGRTST
jgi:hypothetical protein